MRILAGLLWLLCLIGSCKSEEQSVPATVISPPTMQKIMEDYIRADVFASEFLKKDSTVSDTLESMLMQEALFKKHGITREQFYQSYVYYSKNPDRWMAIFDSMQKKSDSAMLLPTLN